MSQSEKNVAIAMEDVTENVANEGENPVENVTELQSTRRSMFEKLNGVNVNEHVEAKQQNGATLSYLSWAWAWAEFKKRCPSATYSVWKDDKGIPYVYDDRTGFMVYTSVTCDGVTHEMWLPVMDGQNRAMKDHPYTYKTSKGEKSVAAATMFDVNKTIMRCLTKNLAMFGLGLYIYAGEDLPEDSDDESTQEKKPAARTDAKAAPVQRREVAEEEVHCKRCNAVIQPYISPKNGGIVSVPQHVAASREKFGGEIYCIDCISQMKKPDNAPKQVELSKL